VVRTQPSQGWYTGSTPVRAATIFHSRKRIASTVEHILNTDSEQNPGLHIYEVRRRKDRRGFDLISDALPFGRLWYGEPNAVSNAIAYAKFYSRSHPAIIRAYDECGVVIETHEQAGDFKEP
jgi:hypothetical protein